MLWTSALSSWMRAERVDEDELSACCTRLGVLESEIESVPGVLSVVVAAGAAPPAARVELCVGSRFKLETSGV